MDKYEFKMHHFGETGKWLTEKGLDDEYEAYLKEVEQKMMRKDEYQRYLATTGCLITGKQLDQAYKKYIYIMTDQSPPS